MRVIIIESDAYWVSEKQFSEIEATHEKVFANYHPDAELEMSDWLEKHKQEYQSLGPVHYDFRL